MYWSIYQNHHPDREVRDLNHRAIMGVIAGRSKWMVSQTGKENFGHGYGTNRGAAIALGWYKPKYLFLVNPDCVWVKPVIDQLVEFLELHPKAALVGPKQMDSQHVITAGGIEGTLESPKHRFWHASDMKNEKARDTIRSPSVAGSAILIRAEVFEELGGMLESGHYYSETWLCYHAQAHGYEVWYHGKPWMIHEWHQSSKVGSSDSDGKMPEDRELFRKMCDEHDPPIRHD
jgi:GT2 family glycosyltransferase